MSKKNEKDLALILGSCEDGAYNVVRKDKDNNVRCGVIKNLEDGKPIKEGAELVSLTPTENHAEYEIKTLYKSESRSKATTNNYRAGYDKIKWN